MDHINSAEAHQLIGQASKMAENGDVTGSLELCRRAAELFPSEVDVFLEYSRIARELGIEDAAKSAAQRSIELDPESCATWLNYGNVLFSWGEFNESIEAYLRATEGDDPRAAIAWCSVVNSYLEVGDTASALAATNRAYELSEGDADIRFEVLEWAASSAITLLDRAQLCLETGDFERALELGKQATLMAPNDFSVWHDFGLMAKVAKSYDEALSALTRATEIEPSSTDGWSNLGTVQRAMGDPLAAVESFCQALLLEPKNHLASNNLARALNGLERFQEARLVLESILEPRSDDLAVRWNLGDSLYGLGDFDGAAIQYREAIRLDPLEPQIYDDLIDALETGGRYSEAREAEAELARVERLLDEPPFDL